MFETKYSRMLTICMIAGITLIVLILGITGVIIAKNGNEKREAQEAVERFKGELSDLDEDTETKTGTNKKNNSTTDGNIIAPEIQLDNVIVNNNSSSLNNGDNNNIKTYNGFPTVGTIEIPAINLSYPILIGGDKAMKESIIIYDPSQTELNIIGNVTLAGHNYRDGRFFANNKKLVEGDKIYITDSTGRKITYSIYKTYITSPEDSTHLERSTEGKREITLTTCTDDTQSRLIILAREQ